VTACDQGDRVGQGDRLTGGQRPGPAQERGVHEGRRIAAVGADVVVVGGVIEHPGQVVVDDGRLVGGVVGIAGVGRLHGVGHRVPDPGCLSSVGGLLHGQAAAADLDLAGAEVRREVGPVVDDPRVAPAVLVKGPAVHAAGGVDRLTDDRVGDGGAGAFEAVVVPVDRAVRRALPGESGDGD